MPPPLELVPPSHVDYRLCKNQECVIRSFETFNTANYALNAMVKYNTSYDPFLVKIVIFDTLLKLLREYFQNNANFGRNFSATCTGRS
jgi:hypothetical protein